MKELIVHAFEQAHDNFTKMLAEFLPRFLVMLIIIAIGFLVAYIAKYIFRAILRVAKVDRVSEQAGASRLLRRAELPTMSELLSRAIFWIIWVGFIMVGISVLGILSLQVMIASLIGLLPQVFVAFLILFVGLLAANFFSRAVLLAGVNAGLPSPKVLSETVANRSRFPGFYHGLGADQPWTRDHPRGLCHRIRRADVRAGNRLRSRRTSPGAASLGEALPEGRQRARG